MRIFYVSLLTTLIVFTSACGGGGSGDDPDPDPGTDMEPDTGDNTDTDPDTGPDTTPGPSGSINYYGFVGLEDNALDTGVDVSGGFMQFNSAILENAFRQGIGAINDAPDTCEVEVSDSAFDFGDIDTDPTDLNISGIVPTLVSAGEAIPFTSSAGTFAELERKTELGFTFYVLPEAFEDGVPGPVPEGLEFDIPGDVFPAYPNVPVPDMMPLVVTNPVGFDSVTSDTEFTWEFEAGSEAVISISVSGFSQTLNGTVFETTFVSLDCLVTDDGSFIVPASNWAEIDATGVTMGAASMSRMLSSLQFSGNSALLITRSSSNQ